PVVSRRGLSDEVRGSPVVSRRGLSDEVRGSPVVSRRGLSDSWRSLLKNGVGIPVLLLPPR
ncbi:MAG: hypothetical protein QNJ65_23225, partial [Xenococcaceae cyanobacterium MO_234.B1]|nr:hypothetical protein [Xenococcaceae cyanobacterium MO_234.B1]